MGLVYNPFSLEGKRILVTGASSGIGQSSAIACSKMGADIIACGRDSTRLSKTMGALVGGNHTSFLGDFCKEETLKKLVESIDPVDGVVFAAGKTMVLPILFSTTEKFKELYGNNLFPNVELLRILVKKKKLKKNSSVVYIISIGGTTSFANGESVYGSAKAALNAFVRYAAIELAPKQIRVNGISPGVVETPMIRNGNVSDEQLEQAVSTYPLKRIGQPEDIAKGAIYLLSDASSWVTGQSLVIDGGASAR